MRSAAALVHPLGRAVLKGLGVDRGGLLARAWVVFGAAVVLVLALVYWPFLAGLPARTRRLFLAAGSLYVGGAVVMEAVYARAEDRYGRLNTPREQAVFTTIEEFSEMMGVVVLAYALISYTSTCVRPGPGRALARRNGSLSVLQPARRTRARAAAVPSAAQASIRTTPRMP